MLSGYPGELKGEQFNVHGRQSKKDYCGEVKC